MLNEGCTVIYSTHQLYEAQQVCDRIIIIHNGVIKADGSPEELMLTTKCSSLEEAYVHLTQEKARMRFEDKKSDGSLGKLWNKLFKPKLPTNMVYRGVDEDE